MRLPSASSSSTEVLVSEASSPLITRPSVVATVYWTKLPSTLRLGSRMWIKSSLAGMAAMPERSGPTWPPSLPWRWHLAHCCWKTSLPAAASPPSEHRRRELVDHFLAVRVGQAAAAGAAASWRGRRSSVRDGRPGLASGRGPARETGACPVSSALDQGRGPVGAAEQRLQDRRAARGRQRRQPLDQRVARPGLPCCAATASIRPAASSGERPGRDQVEQRRAAVSSSAAQLDELPAASMRATSDSDLSLGRLASSDRGDLGAHARRGPGCPRRPTRRTSCPRAPARAARSASCLSASSAASIELGRPVLGPAAGQARGGSPRSPRLAAAERPARPSELIDSVGAAPRPVLGHAARRSRAPRRRAAPRRVAGGQRLQERRSLRAAAAVAASASQRSLRASRVAEASASALAASSDGG